MNKLAITLILVILVIVYGLLAMDYMKQGPEQERLLSEIEEADQSREALPEPSTAFSELLGFRLTWLPSMRRYPVRSAVVMSSTLSSALPRRLV